MVFRDCAHTYCDQSFETDDSTGEKLYCSADCSTRQAAIRRQVRKLIGDTVDLRNNVRSHCGTPNKRFFVTHEEAKQYRKISGAVNQESYDCPCGYIHNRTHKEFDGNL